MWIKIIDQYMLVLKEVHCKSSSTFLGQSMRCVVQHSQNLVPFTQSSPELRVPLSPEGEGLGSRMFATARYMSKKEKNIKFVHGVFLAIINEADV